jgi:hypothetical protein
MQLPHMRCPPLIDMVEPVTNPLFAGDQERNPARDLPQYARRHGDRSSTPAIPAIAAIARKLPRMRV